jgi:hypothetical protein
MSELRSWVGPHQPTPTDLEVEKRSGWHQRGILLVVEHNPRLTWPKRELVRQLAPSSRASRR